MMAGPQRRAEENRFANNSTQSLIANLSRVTSGAKSTLSPAFRVGSTGGFRVASGSHPLQTEGPEPSVHASTTSEGRIRKASSLPHIRLQPSKRLRQDPSPVEGHALSVESPHRKMPRSPFPGTPGEGHVPPHKIEVIRSPPRHTVPVDSQKSMKVEGTPPLAYLQQVDSNTTSRASELTMEDMRVFANAFMGSQGGDTASNMQSWVATMTAAMQRAQRQGGDLDPETKAVLTAITSLGSVTSSQATWRHSPPATSKADIAPPSQGSPQRSPAPKPQDKGSGADAISKMRRRRVAESMEDVVRIARSANQVTQPSQQQSVDVNAALIKPLARMATAPDDGLSSNAPDSLVSLASRTSSKSTNYRVYSNDFQKFAGAQQMPKEELAPIAEAVPQGHSPLDPNSGHKFLLPNKQVSSPWEGPCTAAPVAGQQTVHSAARRTSLEGLLASRPKSRDAAPRPPSESLGIGRPRSERSDQSESQELAATPVARNASASPLPSPAVTNAEQMAAWLRQQYSTLGQAMSLSEAHINRISTQASSNLPQVLARLQAAQQAAGAAAAQGGLPAAAALLHLQGLMQSIGSAVGQPGAPTAAQLPGTFSQASNAAALDVLRDNHVRQVNAKVTAAMLPGLSTAHPAQAVTPGNPLTIAGQWEALTRGVRAPVSSPPDVASLIAHQHNSLNQAKLEEAGFLQAQLSHRDSSHPITTGASVRVIDSGITEASAAMDARPSKAKPPGTSASNFSQVFRQNLPDPHNPFEMQRLAMMRGNAAPLPSPASASPLTVVPDDAPMRPRKSNTPPPDGHHERNTATPFEGHRSAPPRSIGVGSPNIMRVSVVGNASRKSSSPRAATVQREIVLEEATQPEDDRQAAETLLSLFGVAEEERRSSSPDVPKAPKTFSVRTHRNARPPLPDGAMSKQHPVLGTVVPHAPRTLGAARNVIYHSDSSGKSDPSSSDSLRKDSTWRGRSPVSGRAQKGAAKGRGRGNRARADKDEEEWVPRRVPKGLQKKPHAVEPEISDEEGAPLARLHNDSEDTHSA